MLSPHIARMQATSLAGVHHQVPPRLHVYQGPCLWVQRISPACAAALCERLGRVSGRCCSQGCACQPVIRELVAMWQILDAHKPKATMCQVSGPAAQGLVQVDHSKSRQHKLAEHG